MLTLKVLSALLSYPQAEIIDALPEMTAALEAENCLPSKEKAALLGWIETLYGTDLLALQEDYVALFDRGRLLSLHIFEHVHGESRDRGQAMVDLLQLYRANGFEMSARELPDYLPLFLEFLSHQPCSAARQLLQDAAPVLGLLGARLSEKNSPYAVVFDALLSCAEAPPDDLHEIRSRAASEAPDATIVHMDDIWEEETVRFMGNSGTCAGRAQSDAAPIGISAQIPKRQTQSHSF